MYLEVNIYPSHPPKKDHNATAVYINSIIHSFLPYLLNIASGTGSEGATIRLYVEKYDKVNVNLEPQQALKGLIEIATGEQLGRIFEFTGRKEPTVIT